jgi:hypothetical protein
MPHRVPLCALAFCCATCFTVPSHAQTPAASKSTVTKAGFTTPAPEGEQRPADIAEWRRELGLSIIDKLVRESDGYKDQALRVRIQTRAADAIWDTDHKRAHDMFLLAWEIAEKADQEGERSAEEARKRLMSSRGGEMILIPRVPNLRGEVLRLASLRDAELGAKLLSRLDDAKEQDVADSNPENTEAGFFDPTEPKAAIARRLELAVQLLEAGKVDQAKAYAEPSLNPVTSQGIIFLCALRQTEAEGADKLYARLLTSVENDPTADATTVSLLSTYALTPNFLVTATKRARVSRQLSYSGRTYELSPELRARFFSIAAKILLRPLAPPDQDRTSAGKAGTYFTIARLLPLFEQQAANYVPALNAQLAMLAPDAPESFRNGEESMLKLGLTPANSDGDTLSEVLSKLASATSSSERDALYIKAIQVSMANGGTEVRDFAEKINDATLKERARSFTSLVAARNAISKKDVDAGLLLVREGNLSPLHRVWARSQLASLVKKTDTARALQLLNEAAADSKRIKLDETERIYAFVCDAVCLFDLDRPRSWDLAEEAVKAANAVTDFSGDEAKLTARLRAKNVVVMINSDEPSFNMANLFALLAKDDYDRAGFLADKLTGETVRASSKLAIARSILNRSDTPSIPSRR